MRVAALDLGSNTSLLFIADVDGGTIQKVYCDETTVTKMGQGVHESRRLHPDALARLDKCFAEYEALIQKHQAEKVIAIATSAARDVTNREELEKLCAKYKFNLHIASGDQEASLTFKGALSDRNDHEGLGVIDVGGGSTEIISQVRGKVIGQSVDVGSVRLTELCVTKQPIIKRDLDAVHAYAKDKFSRVHIQTTLKEVIAVAGTPTTLAALDQQRPYEEEFVHGYILTQVHLTNWIGRMAKMTVAEREALPGMQPKRGDVIVTGTIILLEAMQALGAHQVRVSTRGVRYGVAMDWKEFI
jgi:exopolyphosphatase/guanosine-5'-triphosphate,3'-diphosphate pyrophosphatase